MAIIIPHQSQAGIQTGNAGNAAQYRSAAAFVTPGQENFGRGLQQLGQGVDRLNGVLFGIKLRERQEQLELDVLKDMQAWQAASEKWHDYYTSQFQGENARDAEAQAQAFQDSKYNEYMGKWRGNAYAERYITKFGVALRNGSINSMRDYARQEGDKYGESVLETEKTNTIKVLSDPRATPEQKEAAYHAYNTKSVAFYTRRGLDAGSVEIQNQEMWKKAQHDDLLNRYNLLEERDPAQAAKLLKIAREHYAGQYGMKSTQLPEEVERTAAKEAENYGVPTALGLAVIAAESAGKVDAISPKGARGLMQLMPCTQKELEQRYGVSGDTPEGNIKLGMAYLNEQLKAFNGDVRLALMAYNWGPGNVQAWLKTGKGVGGKPLPQETTDYVSKILGPQAAAGLYSPDLRPGTLVKEAAREHAPDLSPEQALPTVAGDAQSGASAPAAPSEMELQEENVLRMKGRDYYEHFTPEELMTMQEKLERQTAANSARARALSANADSYMEWAVETGDFTPVIELEKKLAESGQQAAADDLAQSRKYMQTVQPAMQLSADFPLGEQVAKPVATLNSLKTPENAEQVNKVLQMAQTATKKQLEAIAKDPAGFAMGATAMADTLRGNPSMQTEDGLLTEAGITALLAQQERALAGTGIAPRVLPQAIAARIAEKYAAAPDGMAKADMVMALSSTYGKYAAKAFAEAKLPTTVAALAPLFSSGSFNKVESAKLIAAGEMKISDARSLAGDRMKAITSEVESCDFMQGMRALQKAVWGASEQANVSNALETTLMNYVASGNSLGDFTRHFTVVNTEGYAIVEPGRQYNQSLEYLLNDKRREFLQKTQNAKTFFKDSGIPELANMHNSLTGTMALMFRNMYENGIWVFDGQGYALIDPATGQFAVDAKGKKIAVTHDEIAWQPHHTQGDEDEHWRHSLSNSFMRY